jgi:hypothetical protein
LSAIVSRKYYYLSAVISLEKQNCPSNKMDNIFLRSTAFEVRKAVDIAVHVMTSLFGRKREHLGEKCLENSPLVQLYLQGCLG